MKIRVVLAASLAFAAPMSAEAAQQCGIQTPYGVGCRAGIHTGQLPPHICKQMTPVTCWAASFCNLLLFHGVHMSEPRTVAMISGQPTPATPVILNAMLNNTYTDDSGNPFKIQSAITDNMWNTAHQITNTDVYNALINNIPVFYTDANHAMLLVQAIFVAGPNGPTPVWAEVADPDPASPDYHIANLQQIQGMFAAISTITP